MYIDFCSKISTSNLPNLPLITAIDCVGALSGFWAFFVFASPRLFGEWKELLFRVPMQDDSDSNSTRHTSSNLSTPSTNIKSNKKTNNDSFTSDEISPGKPITKLLTPEDPMILDSTTPIVVPSLDDMEKFHRNNIIVMKPKSSTPPPTSHGPVSASGRSSRAKSRESDYGIGSNPDNSTWSVRGHEDATPPSLSRSNSRKNHPIQGRRASLWKTDSENVYNWGDM